MSEEELLDAKDLEARRRLRILRSKTHRMSKIKEKEEGKCAKTTLAGTEMEKDQTGERVSNAVRRMMSPLPGIQDSQRSELTSSRYRCSEEEQK